MLPKYLPPPLAEKFDQAVAWKLSDGMGPAAAFRFVHDAISSFEEQGLEPLAALDEAHRQICPSSRKDISP